jgi:hypothetical protein
MTRRTLGVVAGLVLALPLLARGENAAVRRGDAKAYGPLGETKRLPRLDRGPADRLLGFPRPVHDRRPDDPVPAEPAVRRPIADATCDADLVLIGLVESAATFMHPNGRWLLTAHDLTVTHLARAKDRRLRDLARVRYVHPSGQDTIAGRPVTTTLERYPALTVGDELLFFLVAIDKSPAYRASLEWPPLAVRGGLLYELAPRPAAEGPSIDGTSAREALRIVRDVVCRPAAPRRAPAPLQHTTPFGPAGDP